MNESRQPSSDSSVPPSGRPWYVIAAVVDLIFTAKIAAAAKQAGCEAKFPQSEEGVVAALSAVPAECSPLLIVDLNHSGLNSVALIHRVRSDSTTAGAPILAFLSHTQVHLKRAAEQAGCDLVLPRSVFSQNVQEILRRQSCHLASLEGAQ